METLHFVNIGIHVIAGSVALLAGLAAIVAGKGEKSHVRFGRIFMWMIIVVIFTGLFGVFVFKRNNFLLVITLLSGYNCFSGIRAIKINGAKPVLPDFLAAILVIFSGCYYLYYLNSNGLYWSPVIIFSTLGSLFLVTIYDVIRYYLPFPFLKRAVMFEHVYKMVSAFSAITSAFTGTVLPDYKPYSQFLPSVIGLIYIMITFIFLSKKLPLLRSQIIAESAS